MATTHEKVKLDRVTLEDHGIFYTDGVDRLYESFLPGRSRRDMYCRAVDYLTRNSPDQHMSSWWQTPDHVSWYRDTLVDTSNLLPRYAEKYLKDDEKNAIPPGTFFEDDEYAILSRNMKDHAKERYRQLFQEAHATARKALQLRKGKASEYDWQQFKESDLFKRYQERRSSSFDKFERDHLFDTYETCSNVQWRASRKEEQKDTNNSALPLPKPDLFFGFSVFQFDWYKAGDLEKSDLALNFSAERLETLATEYDIASCPAANLYGFSERLPKKHLTSFPFAVVELKHGSVGARQRDFCYCQAANGASRALSILGKVYSMVNEHNRNQVPAVVAFTCIGPACEYINRNIQLFMHLVRLDEIMACIKEIELASTSAILESHAIIRNMLWWATRVHKPDFSTRSSQWRNQDRTRLAREKLLKEHENEKNKLGDEILRLQDENAQLQRSLKAKSEKATNAQGADGRADSPMEEGFFSCYSSPGKRKHGDDLEDIPFPKRRTERPASNETDSTTLPDGAKPYTACKADDEWPPHGIYMNYERGFVLLRAVA